MSSDSVTVLILPVRPRSKLPCDVLADLPDVLHAQLVQHRPHVAVQVLVGEVGLCVTGHVAASVVVILAVIPRYKELLSSDKLLFMGYISYPLFLIHQNIVTGLAIKFHTIYPNLPSFVYPIPFILIVMFVSNLIANLEPKFKKLLKNIFPKRFFGYQLKKI